MRGWGRHVQVAALRFGSKRWRGWGSIGTRQGWKARLACVFVIGVGSIRWRSTRTAWLA